MHMKRVTNEATEGRRAQKYFRIQNLFTAAFTSRKQACRPFVMVVASSPI
jgi:hypothetical protein